MRRGLAKARIQKRPAIAERIHLPFECGSLGCFQLREKDFLVLSRLAQYFSRWGDSQRAAPALHTIKTPAPVDR